MVLVEEVWAEREVAPSAAAAREALPMKSRRCMGASDGNFAAAAGAKVLDGLGAIGSGAHALTESIVISSVEPRIKLTTAFINELLK